MIKKNLLVKVAILLFLVLSTNAYGDRKPVAQNGLLDLTSWNFQRDGILKITGPWEFYWQKFITNNDKPHEKMYLEFPKDWSNMKINGESLPQSGFASYRMTIKLPQQNSPMAFKLSKIDSAYRLYVNGNLVASNGFAAKTKELTVPQIKPQIADFSCSAKNEIEVILHVADFYTDKGEPEGSIYIGAGTQIAASRGKNLIIEFFLIGCLIFMGFYHLGLFVLRKKDRTPFFFGVFCLLIALRTMLMGERYIMTLVPEIPFWLMVKLEFLTMYIGVPIIIMFLYTLFKKESPKIVVKAFVVVGAVSSLLITFLPVPLVVKTLPFYQVVTLLSGLYLLFVIVRALIAKRTGALIFLLSGLVFFGTIVNDILHAQQIITTGYYIAFGLLVFFFAQAFLISMRFSLAFFSVERLSKELSYKSDELVEANEKLTDLNLNLEIKVEDRTGELLAANEELHAMNDELVLTRDALWGEMELAKKIQTVLLPDKPAIDGYDIAVHIAPADKVGGDYYDVVNVEGKDWVVIGDVSGHGVPAGLIMMMVQTSIQVVLTQHPDMHPSELLSTVNTTITKNIKKLNEDKYMTITVLACFDDGQFYFSGLHQDILIYRKNKESVDLIQTNGTWLGIMEDISSMVEDDSFVLDIGDTMLLYTDGITEAWIEGSIKDHRDPEFDMYGDKRLKETLEQKGLSSSEEIKNHLLASTAGYVCDDDVTLVVLKRLK